MPKPEKSKGSSVSPRPPEPEPLPLTIIEEPLKFEFNENQKRVLFPKLPVKKIVSYHSGTILADEDPNIELSKEQMGQAMAAFQSVASLSPSNLGLTAIQLIDVMIKLGAPDSDKEFLSKIIEERLSLLMREYPPSPPDAETDLSQIVVNQEMFLKVYSKFLAPSFFFAQRLRLFCGRGEVEAARRLLFRGCSVNSANGEGLTPLHYCCESNQTAVLEMLRSFAGSGLLINAQDKYGWTPLHCAAFNGNVQCVAKLLSFAEIDLTVANREGKSALHLAAFQNRGIIVNQLLNAGCSLNQEDIRGMTAVHEAAYRGRTSLYQELIRDVRANLSARDKMSRLSSDYISED